MSVPRHPSGDRREPVDPVVAPLIARVFGFGTASTRPPSEREIIERRARARRAETRRARGRRIARRLRRR